MIWIIWNRKVVVVVVDNKCNTHKHSHKRTAVQQLLIQLYTDILFIRIFYVLANFSPNKEERGVGARCQIRSTSFGEMKAPL